MQGTSVNMLYIRKSHTPAKVIQVIGETELFATGQPQISDLGLVQNITTIQHHTGYGTVQYCIHKWSRQSVVKLVKLSIAESQRSYKRYRIQFHRPTVNLSASSRNNLIKRTKAIKKKKQKRMLHTRSSKQNETKADKSKHKGQAKALGFSASCNAPGDPDWLENSPLVSSVGPRALPPFHLHQPRNHQPGWPGRAAMGQSGLHSTTA